MGIAPLPIDVSSSVEGAIQQAGTPASVAGAIALVGFIWAASGMMGAMRLAFTAVWGGEVGRPYLRGKLLDGALVLGAGLLDPDRLRADDRRPGRDGDEYEDRRRSRLRRACDRRDRSRWRSSAPRSPSSSPPSRCSIASCRPSRSGSWTSLPGAAFATVGVHLAVAGFSVYLDRFADFDDIYGPLGAVLAFLLLVWLTAAILLVGACVAAAWPQAAQPVLLDAEGPLTARLARAAKGLVVRDRS